MPTEPNSSASAEAPPSMEEKPSHSRNARDLELQSARPHPESLGRPRSNKSPAIGEIPETPLMDMSRNIVGWDGEDDPENPRNWPHRQRMMLLTMVSMITFVRLIATVPLLCWLV